MRDIRPRGDMVEGWRVPDQQEPGQNLPQQREKPVVKKEEPVVEFTADEVRIKRRQDRVARSAKPEAIQ